MSVAPSSSAALPPDWRTLIPPAARLRLAVIMGLLAWAYWDVLTQQLAWPWMNDANWSHGWLIPVFSLYFLHTRRDQLSACAPRANYWGAILLALSLTAYFVSAWRLRMAYPQALSLVGAIFGLTLLMGGWAIMRVAWFPIAFLVLSVPLPAQYYVNLTMPLRRLASQVAAAVMPLFAPGLHTEAQSVVIDYIMPGYGSGQLNVEEACSGMRSIMAFVTLGVAMAYLHERPAWQRVILVLLCVPIAVFCNAIRVTVTGLLYVYNHRSLAEGTPHTLLGVLMFVVALGLFSLVGYVLQRLFVDAPEEPSASLREGAA